MNKSTFSGLFWNCSWIQNFWQSIFQVTSCPYAPCLDLLFVIKYYFCSAQGNLNNRPSQELTVGPNWSWMSFSKLPYLSDVLWPITTTPDNFPGFCNEKDSEAGTVPFVVMLYFFRVCDQGCMYFIFLLYLLIFACFYNQFNQYDIFSSTVGLQTTFNYC